MSDKDMLNMLSPSVHLSPEALREKYAGGKGWEDGWTRQAEQRGGWDER